MKTRKTTLTVVLGSAFAASVTLSPAACAAENPFALKPLASGYMVADNGAAEDKMEEGKCGEGKCGSKMKMKAKDKAKSKSAESGEDKPKQEPPGSEKSQDDGGDHH